MQWQRLWDGDHKGRHVQIQQEVGVGGHLRKIIGKKHLISRRIRKYSTKLISTPHWKASKQGINSEIKLRYGSCHLCCKYANIRQLLRNELEWKGIKDKTILINFCKYQFEVCPHLSTCHMLLAIMPLKEQQQWGYEMCFV